MISTIAQTSVPQLLAPATRGLSATAPENASQTAPQPPPSVVVSLSGASGPASAATYARPPMPVWQMHSTDGVTLRIARQYNVETNIGRFSGLGAALVRQFESNGADFAQSVSLHPGAGEASTAFSMKVTTASGKTVTFSLMGSEGELAVRTDASDALDDGERAAVSALADSFQKAMDGLTGGRPKLDLTALTGFDKSLLTSVDFTATTASDGAAPMTIAMHADATSRMVKVKSGSGTVDISVDASQAAILGSRSQRAKAMADYLDQVDKATARGQGNRTLATLFKDAFTELQSADDVALGSTRPNALQLSKAEHAMLSGLADYHASFAQVPTGPNPLRPGELDEFSFDTVQSTRISATNTRNREISQHRSTHLVASFHSPLKGVKLALGSSPASQNYLYTQIDDKTDTQADIAYRNGILVKASLTQSVSQSTHQMKYVMGKLVENTETPVSHSSTQDLVALLATLSDKEDDAAAGTR